MRITIPGPRTEPFIDAVKPRTLSLDDQTVEMAKVLGAEGNASRGIRAALGLKRKEVYVHDDDWPELLKLAKRLERRRAKLLASGAG